MSVCLCVRAWVCVRMSVCVRRLHIFVPELILPADWLSSQLPQAYPAGRQAIFTCLSI
jgi:hypothetical protein